MYFEKPSKKVCNLTGIRYDLKMCGSIYLNSIVYQNRSKFFNIYLNLEEIIVKHFLGILDSTQRHSSPSYWKVNSIFMILTTYFLNKT